MVYTNDEGDKSTRQRVFFTTVYLLPVLTVAIICAVIYWATSQKLLTKTDAAYGYITSLTIAVFVFAFNRRYWLKMPDGTYHNIKDVAPNKTFNLNEPAVYEAEFFYSKKEKATTTVAGFFLVAVSVWLGFNSSKTILVPIMTNISGLFLLYVGLKGLLDKSAQLKIAKNGLWTKKLGFVNWDDINFADVIEDKKGKSPQTYLEIRLKGTKFEEANQPDERLVLTDLKGKENVELLINDSITNYNKQKNQL